jgi:hypothetical protein
VRQSVAGKEVNMEAEESTVLGPVIKQRLVKTTDSEDLLRAVLTCRVCRSVKQLQLIVVNGF